MDTFGARLQSEREDRGLTIQAVAERLGVEQDRLLALERNEFEAHPDDAAMLACLSAYADVPRGRRRVDDRGLRPREEQVPRTSRRGPSRIAPWRSLRPRFRPTENRQPSFSAPARRLRGGRDRRGRGRLVDAFRGRNAGHPAVDDDHGARDHRVQRRGARADRVQRARHAGRATTERRTAATR